MGTMFQLGKMKKVLEVDCGSGYTIMQRYVILLNCALKNGSHSVYSVTYHYHKKKIRKYEYLTLQ